MSLWVPISGGLCVIALSVVTAALMPPALMPQALKGSTTLSDLKDSTPALVSLGFFSLIMYSAMLTDA